MISTTFKLADRLRDLWMEFFLVAAIVATFANGLWGAFVFDDNPNIVDHEGLRDFWGTVRNLPYSTRPITELSLALNLAITGPTETGFHVINIAAHALATVILFKLVLFTLQRHCVRDWIGLDAPWMAFAVAVLWGVHPIQSQSVTYIIQRAQVFSGLFQLVALYGLARGAGSLRPRRLYLVAIVSAFLAVGSKQDAVVLPILALLYDRIYLAGTWRETVSLRWGVHLGLFASWFGLFWSFRFAIFGFAGLPNVTETVTNSAIAIPTAGFGVEHISWWQYSLTQTEAILHYLQIAFWPNRLVFDHFDWPPAKGVGDVFASIVATGFLLSLTLVLLVRRPTLGYPAVWTFVELAPTSSVLPIDDLVVEHRMYSALIGPVVFFVVGLLCTSRNWNEPSAGRIRWAAFLCVATVLATSTIYQNSLFYHRDALWLSVLQHRANNGRASHAMAYSLTRDGRYVEAIPYLERSARIAPTQSTLGFLADAYARTGRRSDAIRVYGEAIDALPSPGRGREFLSTVISLDQMHFNLAKLLDDSGNKELAMAHYRESIRLNSMKVGARVNLGTIFAREGDWIEAYETLREAVRCDPESTVGLNNLALVAARMGRYDESLNYFADAARHNPSDLRTYDNWASLLVRIGRPGDAVPIFRKGRSISPQDPRLSYGLAHALFASGDDHSARIVFGESNRFGRGWLMNAARSSWATATRPNRASDFLEAVRLAEIIVRATDESECESLDILAVAYASCGRYRDAINAADKALARCGSSKSELSASIRMRRELYKNGMPYVESP